MKKSEKKMKDEQGPRGDREHLQQFRNLISEAAVRFSKLIRVGPSDEFIKAQDDLMLICRLYEWYRSWQARSLG